MLKQISLIVLVASVATTAYAKCPNECSGKGVCGENDLCKCYAGYTGLDCSGRLCLFGKAWGDAPFADGYAHDYVECSGQGECDRKSGECKCNDGFTGDGCRYSACPNDCNGHGTCEFITELAAGTATAAAGRTHIQYSEFVDQDRTLDGWDSKKARGCKCDPYYSGPDCSVRMCPKGNDPLTKTTALSAQSRNYYADIKDLGVAELEKPEIQSVFVTPPERHDNKYTAIGGHFTLTYTDMYGQSWTTRPIRVKTRVQTQATISSGIIKSNTGEFGMFKDHDNIEVQYAGNTRIVKVKQDGAGFQGLAVQPTLSDQAETTFTLTLVNQDCGEIGVKRALMELPNQVIPSITVDETITGVLNMFRITFSDSANSGDQHMLSCKADACDEDGCQPRKGALTALYTDNSTAAIDFNAADFSITTTLAQTFAGASGVAQVGDEVGFGGGDASVLAPNTGVMTKSLVVASVDAANNKVFGTDRTIALADSTSGRYVQIINRIHDRDKRVALQVTLTASDTVGAIASSVFTCGTSDECAGFKINDLVRLHSVMVAGQNQPAMDGIHVVTAIGGGGDTVTLASTSGTAIADESDGNIGTGSGTRSQIVLTRLNTFPCSVEETRKGTSESLECSGRGACDGNTGECKCFEGYTSDDCSIQTVLQ